MTEPRSALDDLDFMKALLDVLIPPSENLPGAGALDLAPTVASALQGDPMLGPVVETGAQAVREAALSQHPEGLPGMAPQAGAKVVEAQVGAHPLLILGMLRYLYPAYYQHPRVLEGIGEPPRPPFPEGFEVEATDPGLLDKLRARRKSPGAG